MKILIVEPHQSEAMKLAEKICAGVAVTEDSCYYANNWEESVSQLTKNQFDFITLPAEIQSTKGNVAGLNLVEWITETQNKDYYILVVTSRTDIEQFAVSLGYEVLLKPFEKWDSERWRLCQEAQRV